MTPDQTLAVVAIVGALGTVANLWLTLSIKNSILGLKLWTTQNFVGKDDLPQYLQMAESKVRVLREQNARPL